MKSNVRFFKTITCEMGSTSVNQQSSGQEDGVVIPRKLGEGMKKGIRRKFERYCCRDPHKVKIRNTIGKGYKCGHSRARQHSPFVQTHTAFFFTEERHLEFSSWIEPMLLALSPCAHRSLGNRSCHLRARHG